MKKIFELLLSVFRSFLKQPSVTTTKEESNDSILRMEIDRIFFTRNSTIGELRLDGLFECHTLEDEDKLRQGLSKVYGVTAIPSGTYEVEITYSPKYRRQMPLLKNVKGFSGIRIHSGNVAEDSEGCILVGVYKENNPDFIGQSRKTYNKLFKKLEKAVAEGKRIQIEVR